MTLAMAGCNLPVVSGSGVPAPSAPAVVPQAQCSDWLRLQHTGQGTLYGLDATASTLRMLVFRGGRLASLGHNHVIAAEQHAQGQIYLPKDGLTTAGAELAFRLDQLVLDAPVWRTAMGDEFAKTLSDADIAGTRANMLKALDADTFPLVKASTVAVTGGWPRPVLTLGVWLHGQYRTVELPVEAIRPEGEAPLRAKGRMVVRQSDFGIRPFTVLGGLLAIQDALVVELDLVARPTSACAPLPDA
ncbi:hypothetical protein OU995_13390 [Roseateles sp. SL47]|uniref:hypothetical protein n=1 Tax=Roseateles sp. SL47 TaxID=2995138 RepID=UPI00226D775F|nr:hypothetical protein [Roseateles sp. SL47]WAC75622.1 hypothetical protein OU995_13390 [Roseateles sp. SL47]